MLPLTEVFPDEDYRFHLTLRPGDARLFFAPTTPEVLAERKRWITSDPERYVAVTEAAGRVVEAFEQWVSLTAAESRGSRVKSGPIGPRLLAAELMARMSTLGQTLEPDFVLLSPDGSGVLRLQAGIACFPSSWAIEEKIGKGVEEIHGPVPTLNASLGASIDRFLARLRPGLAFERANWGLAATPEPNMHPALQRPRLTAPLNVDRVWIRIEDQLLAALPDEVGIVFGVRLRIIPLREVLKDGEIGPRLVRAIRTMPDEIAAYKGIAEVRRELANILG